MKFFAKILITIVINAVALLAAQYLVPGLHLTGNFRDLVIVGLSLTLLNALLKPLLKLALGPVIILTFGFAMVAVNALILYVLDLFSKNLTIDSIPSLIYASLIVSALNFILHIAF